MQPKRQDCKTDETDLNGFLALPSATPFFFCQNHAAAGGIIRLNPFNPFHPFFHHVALEKCKAFTF
jgi:hypothetical protein